MSMQYYLGEDPFPYEFKEGYTRHLSTSRSVDACDHPMYVSAVIPSIAPLFTAMSGRSG